MNKEAAQGLARALSVILAALTLILFLMDHV